MGDGNAFGYTRAAGRVDDVRKVVRRPIEPGQRRRRWGRIGFRRIDQPERVVPCAAAGDARLGDGAHGTGLTKNRDDPDVRLSGADRQEGTARQQDSQRRDDLLGPLLHHDGDEQVVVPRTARRSCASAVARASSAPWLIVSAAQISASATPLPSAAREHPPHGAARCQVRPGRIDLAISASCGLRHKRDAFRFPGRGLDQPSSSGHVGREHRVELAVGEEPVGGVPVDPRLVPSGPRPRRPCCRATSAVSG